MPDIRPFRALRFEPGAAGDLARLVAPPYDVIGPALHETLLARSPRNAVRLDFPAVVPGEDPDERYRRAAHTLAAWRSDGTLRKDPRPSVYVYEQAYRVPGTDVERTQRGFFARLRIEPFGPGSSVLPHERTLTGPKEERYRLLRATSVNTSPVIGLFKMLQAMPPLPWSAWRRCRRMQTSRTTMACDTASGWSRRGSAEPPKPWLPRPARVRL